MQVVAARVTVLTQNTYKRYSFLVALYFQYKNCNEGIKKRDFDIETGKDT